MTHLLGLLFLMQQPELLNVRRIHVEKLNGENAAQMRDMIVSSLENSGIVLVTDNPERADAILRGSAEDVAFIDVYQSGESTSARGSTSVTQGAQRASARTNRYGSISAAERETVRTTDRRHEAMASLRLVNKDGDVIWSTTQESRGAKFRGAGADVANKVTRKLAEDLERARKSPPSK